MLLREQAESIAAHARAGRRGKQRGEQEEKGGRIAASTLESRESGGGRGGRRSDRLHVESLADQHPVFATPVAIAPLLRFEPRISTVLPPPPLPHITKISPLSDFVVSTSSLFASKKVKKGKKKKKKKEHFRRFRKFSCDFEPIVQQNHAVDSFSLLDIRKEDTSKRDRDVIDRFLYGAVPSRGYRTRCRRESGDPMISLIRRSSLERTKAHDRSIPRSLSSIARFKSDAVFYVPISDP